MDKEVEDLSDLCLGDMCSWKCTVDVEWCASGRCVVGVPSDITGKSCEIGHDWGENRVKEGEDWEHWKGVVI